MELPVDTNTDILPDQANKAKRIGLGSYNADVHPYIKEDIITISEHYPNEYEFLNMAPSANKMRLDLASKTFIPYLYIKVKLAVLQGLSFGSYLTL